MQRHFYDVIFKEHTDYKPINQSLGSFWTVEEANKATKSGLTTWSTLESFDDVEEHEYKGELYISAMQYGSQVEVYTQKVSFPDGPPPLSGEKCVYVIVLTHFENSEDKQGRKEVGSGAAYESLKEANAAAHQMLKEACKAETGGDEIPNYEVLQGGETDDKLEYKAAATVFRNALHAIHVEVKKLRLEPEQVLVKQKKRDRDSSDDSDEEKEMEVKADEEDTEPPTKKVKSEE